jgi:hypothetical protein
MRKRWLMAVCALGGLTLGVSCGGARLPTRRAGETVLTVEGQVLNGPYFLQRTDLAALPRAGFRARAPGAAATARYDGVALLPFLSTWVQPTEGADTVVFVTQDGLAMPLSGPLIRQYGPILADLVDGRPVPPQLAWPNQDQRGLDADPRAAFWWTGPVMTLEVVAWDRTWGRAFRPPPGSSDAARLGAGQYVLRCGSCHRLHGVGGQRGPALDGAVQRLGLGPFVAAVTRHPGWPERVGADLTSGEDVALQVAGFVSASDQAGLEPVEPRARPPVRVPMEPAHRPGSF